MESKSAYQPRTNEGDDEKIGDHTTTIKNEDLIDVNITFVDNSSLPMPMEPIAERNTNACTADLNTQVVSVEERPTLASKEGESSFPDLTIPINVETAVPSTSSKGRDEKNYNRIFTNSLIQTLEDDIRHLKTELKVKEGEWNRILKTLKLKEVVHMQLTRQEVTREIVDAATEKGQGSLETLLKWIQDEASPTKSDFPTSQASSDEADGNSLWENQIHDVVVQTLAQGLGRKSKIGRGESSPRPNFPKPSSIVEPKRGTKQSLIQEGITSLLNQCGSNGQSRLVSNDGSQEKEQPPPKKSNPTFSPLNMSPQIKFTDMLLNLKKMTDSDALAGTAPAVRAGPTKRGHAKTMNQQSPVRTPVKRPRKASKNEFKEGPGPTVQGSLLLIPDVNLSAGVSVQEEPSDLSTGPMILCQGCGINSSQFVCAGCSQQWYCSQKCQVSAWDKHSVVCSYDEED